MLTKTPELSVYLPSLAAIEVFWDDVVVDLCESKLYGKKKTQLLDKALLENQTEAAALLLKFGAVTSQYSVSIAATSADDLLPLLLIHSQESGEIRKKAYNFIKEMDEKGHFKSLAYFLKTIKDFSFIQELELSDAAIQYCIKDFDDERHLSELLRYLVIKGKLDNIPELLKLNLTPFDADEILFHAINGLDEKNVIPFRPIIAQLLFNGLYHDEQMKRFLHIHKSLNAGKPLLNDNGQIKQYLENYQKISKLLSETMCNEPNTREFFEKFLLSAYSRLPWSEAKQQKEALALLEAKNNSEAKFKELLAVQSEKYKKDRSGTYASLLRYINEDYIDLYVNRRARAQEQELQTPIIPKEIVNQQAFNAFDTHFQLGQYDDALKKLAGILIRKEMSEPIKALFLSIAFKRECKSIIILLLKFDTKIDNHILADVVDKDYVEGLHLIMSEDIDNHFKEIASLAIIHQNAVIAEALFPYLDSPRRSEYMLKIATNWYLDLYINYIDKKQPSFFYEVMIHCVEQNLEESVLQLLNASIKVDGAKLLYKNPLHKAINRNHINMVHHFLIFGAKTEESKLSSIMGSKLGELICVEGGYLASREIQLQRLMSFIHSNRKIWQEAGSLENLAKQLIEAFENEFELQPGTNFDYAKKQLEKITYANDFDSMKVLVKELLENYKGDYMLINLLNYIVSDYFTMLLPKPAATKQNVAISLNEKESTAYRIKLITQRMISSQFLPEGKDYKTLFLKIETFSKVSSKVIVSAFEVKAQWQIDALLGKDYSQFDEALFMERDKFDAGLVEYACWSGNVKNLLWIKENDLLKYASKGPVSFVGYALLSEDPEIVNIALSMQSDPSILRELRGFIEECEHTLDKALDTNFSLTRVVCVSGVNIDLDCLQDKLKRNRNNLSVNKLGCIAFLRGVYKQDNPGFKALRELSNGILFRILDWVMSSSIEVDVFYEKAMTYVFPKREVAKELILTERERLEKFRVGSTSMSSSVPRIEALVALDKLLNTHCDEPELEKEFIEWEAKYMPCINKELHKFKVDGLQETQTAACIKKVKEILGLHVELGSKLVIQTAQHGSAEAHMSIL